MMFQSSWERSFRTSMVVAVLEITWMEKHPWNRMKTWNFNKIPWFLLHQLTLPIFNLSFFLKKKILKIFLNKFFPILHIFSHSHKKILENSWNLRKKILEITWIFSESFGNHPGTFYKQGRNSRRHLGQVSGLRGW